MWLRRRWKIIHTLLIDQHRMMLMCGGHEVSLIIMYSSSMLELKKSHFTKSEGEKSWLDFL